MKRLRNAVTFLGFISLFGAAGFAQGVVSYSVNAGGNLPPCRVTLHPPPRVVMMLSGPVAPYSGVEKSTSVRTLADGTHITNDSPFIQKTYRDSSSRRRTERPMCGRKTADNTAVLVEIRDPVAGYGYILDPGKRIAYRFQVEVIEPRPRDRSNPATPQPPPPSSDGRPRPTTTTESLGSDVIEGISVEGTRYTTVFPPGSRGNDGPIAVVRDEWHSPELGGILIMAKTVDPINNAESTIQLTDIDLSEPLISLFQPPPEYQVVDVEGDVTITFTRK
jgi:hypothetical protein